MKKKFTLKRTRRPDKEIDPPYENSVQVYEFDDKSEVMREFSNILREYDDECGDRNEWITDHFSVTKKNMTVEITEEIIKEE